MLSHQENKCDEQALPNRKSFFILRGGWRHEESRCAKQTPSEKYRDYPLVQSMIASEDNRRHALEQDGKMQLCSVKSTDGWVRTLMTIEGRALDRIWFPWAFLTLNAVVWTVLSQLVFSDVVEEPDESWEFFFGIVINTSLSFLLVFRLNRAAERFWLARENWGTIVGAGRQLVSETLVHGEHDPQNRDEVIRWMAAYAVATMQFMRSIPEIPPEFLEGIMDSEDVKRMEKAPNPPIYAADQLRAALKKLFPVTADTPTSIAILWTRQLDSIETIMNRIMDQEGAMERIKASPLPLVHVAHLRTFLLIFLMALPYVWERSWSWATIPVTSLASFALLGLEGASQECEAPFKKQRSNHMNMDGFCLLIMSNIQQSITHAADREIAERTKEVRPQKKTGDVPARQEVADGSKKTP